MCSLFAIVHVHAVTAGVLNVGVKSQPHRDEEETDYPTPPVSSVMKCNVSYTCIVFTDAHVTCIVYTRLQNILCNLHVHAHVHVHVLVCSMSSTYMIHVYTV